jgi:3-hydroxyisobutyrate dehydrogenase-like beta-hydroxyacid dehydrogenase
VSRVAVIGLGAMGSRIASRLLDAGHTLVVWNRTPDKAMPLVERGATLAETPADAARAVEVVITMVADPQALEDITPALTEAATVIEMSTVGPAAIARLRSALPDEVELLDAPVLGSIAEAESGSLHVFVGGPPHLFERWQQLLSVLGTPHHVGALGAGAAAKLVANSTLFGTIGVLGEALALADALGIGRDATFEVLAATPIAAQAERRRPAIESGEFPPRFPIRLARKDADLVAEAAREKGVDLHLAEAAHSWLAEADAASWHDRDYSALIAWIARAPAEYARSNKPTRRQIMWARVATFEGGNQEELQRMNEERMSSGDMNPPEGMKRVMLLADADKNRRLFISFFDSRDELTAAEERFESMGDEVPEDVRGRRTGVDYYEVATDQSV